MTWQSVDRVVVAVEAMEGTDAMIGRCGALSGRGVVVKMMRSDQNLRYAVDRKSVV